MILKEFPLEELPREKVMNRGVQSLSNVELIAILLRTGTRDESVLALAQAVLNHVGGMEKLKQVEYEQLVQIKGIKKAKAITLMASVELTKRLMIKSNKQRLKTPLDIYEYVVSEVLFENREKVYVLCFNIKLEVIKMKLLCVGTVDQSLIDHKDIFKEAFLCGSNIIALIHNHPSGDPTPSKADIDVTKKIGDMAKKFDIECIDHLIIGENCFYSFSNGCIIDL